MSPPRRHAVATLAARSITAFVGTPAGDVVAANWELVPAGADPGADLREGCSMAEAGDDGLAQALGQFDRVAANLQKLEEVWNELESLTPDGIVFGADTPERDNLVREFALLVQHLPAIDGYRIESMPLPMDGIAQDRLDACDIGEIDAQIDVERLVQAPGRELAEYRFRFAHARRALVRDQVLSVVEQIDAILREVTPPQGGFAVWGTVDRWEELRTLIATLDRLVGDQVPGQARWTELRRHLRFAQGNDLSDIATMDWPSVRDEVQSRMYAEREPVPVSLDDLGEVVRARPTGPVSTRMNWSALSAEGFEGVIFEMIRQTPGYENVRWLMKTNATDRGRDIDANHVTTDPLTGVRRARVIIQCKHWLAKSVGRDDLVTLLESVRLWEPPRIDIVIVATTGRFSQDAVAIAERRNHELQAPRVELWPDSHLETLLARRPAIAGRFGLT